MLMLKTLNEEKKITKEMKKKKIEISFYILLLMLGILGFSMWFGIFNENIRQAFNEYWFQIAFYRIFP
ncbi:MAG: hypothetical protein ACTSVY_04685 [Candidatus Helarchaeota archaeon]